MTSHVISYGDAVNDALERMDDLGYERGAQGDLANHGPMGAEALAVMGHGEQVAAWVEGYRHAMPHHEPPAPRFALDPADEASWRPALGTFNRAGDWERLFERELADRPWRDVLARWWGRLLPGTLAGLTHGMIRTAHAVRGLAATPHPSAAQLTEFARGLAYWAARYTGLPGEAAFQGPYGTQGSPGSGRLADAVAALPRRPMTAHVTRGGAAERLRAVDEFAGYREALHALAPADPQLLLSEMTAEFAGIYLAHPEVFPVPLIHGVTAPAAARLVLPHLPAELHTPTLAALWQVHVALLLAFTGDRQHEEAVAGTARETPVPAFDELAARALEHQDEHVIKFTEACIREHALRPDPRFAAAVLAAQQRIPRR
ncbi:questin oxidase family protein [Streptantibioticus ferralitis]|uniref:Questin oxidase family protein n=1 Tax=Streptantibioticus ferralitis TaxID=236510 RepID=A0ABT5Z473_9ACTN|nr:questin oxidase family protein [Streptantibioticus ferralitis]MDF2258504.1 questin oxidase family protein [Streptantibioticus ferralitis]